MNSLPPYSLRPAIADDQKIIRHFINAHQLNPMGLNWSNFLVAEGEDGLFVGCGQIKPHRDGSRELASIAVLTEWREQGVGGAIIKQLMAQEQGELWLTCLLPMVTYYERFGFRQLVDGKLMPRYFRLVWWGARLFHLLLPWTRPLAVMKARESTSHAHVAKPTH